MKVSIFQRILEYIVVWAAGFTRRPVELTEREKFLHWLAAQPAGRPINHSQGWYDCAVGDYAREGAGFKVERGETVALAHRLGVYHEMGSNIFVGDTYGSAVRYFKRNGEYDNLLPLPKTSPAPFLLLVAVVSSAALVAACIASSVS